MSDFYIAFVDDEVDLTEAYQELFASKYTIKTFNSAEDYLEFVITQNNRNPFDVTITDYKMGTMNGIEMIIKTMEHDCSRPFILLSGHVDQELLKKSIRNDVIVTLVEKPPDIKCLDALIAKILNQKLKTG